MKRTAGKFFILLILFCTSVNAQQKTNLDIINNLIEKSVTKVDSILNVNKSINLSVTAPSSLELLKSKIFKSFQDNNYTLSASSNESNPTVNYTLSTLKVEYKNPFSDGLFSSLLAEREISLNSTFTITGIDKKINSYGFNETKIDTVKLDEIHSLENPTLPFTQSEIPSSPLLSNLWEPILVVGTLIITIVLLFSVRSK